MTILYVLIPVTIGMGLVGLTAFFWSLGAGQYDDPAGAAARILDQSDEPAAPVRHHPTASAGSEDGDA